jgi:hypothetical protein
MTTEDLRRRVLRFVRDYDDDGNRLTPESEVAELLGPDLLPDVLRILRDLQADVGVQFVAHEARLADFRARCALAESNYERISVQTDDRDESSVELLPPTIALDLFTARELRWKVRTARFLNLIERALSEALPDASEVSILLAAIQNHRTEMEADTGPIDEELYLVADKIRAART